MDKFYGTKSWGGGGGGVGVPTTLIFLPFYPIVKQFFSSVGLFCLLLFLFVVGLFACLFVCLFLRVFLIVVFSVSRRCHLTPKVVPAPLNLSFK